MRRTRSITSTRRLRQFGAAVTTLAVVTGLTSHTLTSAAPPTDDPETAGSYAAGWLAGQLDAAIPLVNFGSGDWGVTLDAAIALAAAETGSTQLDAVWAALVADPDAVVDPYGSGDLPGRLARVILLAHALGESPTAVGTGPDNDMVARLLATVTTDGPDAGLFGDPSSITPTWDGAYRQGYSIAAVVAAGAPVPASAWQWLLAQQCPDGSWMPYRAQVEGVLQECAFDATNFVGPDSNSTAAAVNGLQAAGQGASAVTSAAGWLATVQNPDGGWGYFPADPSEPSSTALVWQALVDAGLGGDAVYLDGSGTPLQALLSFQLGCTSAAADRGALTYPGSNGAPNLFSTAQAVPTLVGVPLEFGPVTPGDTTRLVDCTVPTTTTTTAPTTTTTTTPVTTTTAPTTTAPVSTTPSTATPAAGASQVPTEVAASVAARSVSAQPISFVG